MKYRPFLSYLGKPLNLPTGKAWYEEDILNAERQFVKQFESPSTEIKGRQGVYRGDLIRLLQYIQENNWHWEEDGLLGDIWYQETESGKSEVLNSGMLADKFINDNP